MVGILLFREKMNNIEGDILEPFKAIFFLSNAATFWDGWMPSIICAQRSP